MRKIEWAIAALVVVVLLVLGAWRAFVWYEGPYQDTQSRLEIEASAPAKQSEGDYVSSRDCQSCHPQAYETWHASYHRKMTQLATKEAIVGDFDDVELAWTPPSKDPAKQGKIERYRLSERDGEYWVTWLSPYPSVPDRDGRIVMTTGSHNHQILWMKNGEEGDLVNLPFTYLVDQKRWIPRADSFLSPPDAPFGLVYWNQVCIQCHSTAGRPRIKEGEESDTQVTELGIACESCHGPAGPHVEANQSPLNRWLQRDQPDSKIVNPKRLSARASSDVCGRCHSIVSYAETNTWEGHWNDFSPGGVLESNGRIVLQPGSRDPMQRRAVAEHVRAEGSRFLRDRFWLDGGVRVAGREYNDVLSSPCTKGGDFGCISCHSLHGYESTADQLAPGMDGDEACLQCHATYKEELSKHTRHLADSGGSRCMNCHMPYTTYGLLKGIRSHRVSSPSVKAERDTGRPNACNACHLNRSLGWTQDRLASDFGIAPVPISNNLRIVPAGPRWISTGDAGVRALAGWYMGWELAKQASGVDWKAPYVAELLADPYAAVRAVAAESLRTLPGFSELDYDFVEAKDEIGEQARIRVQVDWFEQPHPKAGNFPGPLMINDQAVDRQVWEQLTRMRDNMPIALSE